MEQIKENALSEAGTSEQSASNGRIYLNTDPIGTAIVAVRTIAAMTIDHPKHWNIAYHLNAIMELLRGEES